MLMYVLTREQTACQCQLASSLACFPKSRPYSASIIEAKLFTCSLLVVQRSDTNLECNLTCSLWSDFLQRLGSCLLSSMPGQVKLPTLQHMPLVLTVQKCIVQGGLSHTALEYHSSWDCVCRPAPSLHDASNHGICCI